MVLPSSLPASRQKGGALKPAAGGPSMANLVFYFFSTSASQQATSCMGLPASPSRRLQGEGGRDEKIHTVPTCKVGTKVPWQGS